MPLFDDEEEDDRKQRTKAPPGKPMRGAPVRPQPAPTTALTQPVAASPSEVDLDFDFNESSSSAAARRAAAMGRIGLVDSGIQAGDRGNAQRTSLDLAAVKAANAERQNHLDAIAVKKLLRERKEEANNPELAEVDKAVGQYVTPSYAKRMAVLRKTHGDLLAGAEEAEEEYYSSLTAKPKPSSAVRKTDSETEGRAYPPPAPVLEKESEAPEPNILPPSSSEKQGENSDGVGRISPSGQLPSVPQPAAPSAPPAQDVLSEYRKTKESLDASRRARREARAHRQLADSYIDEQRRQYEEEKALRMRQMSQFVRLHPELVKTLP
jgi:hypothetical protein